MKVTITFEDNFFPLEVSEDLELENLKALLEFETGVPSVDIEGVEETSEGIWCERWRDPCYDKAPVEPEAGSARK